MWGKIELSISRIENIFSAVTLAVGIGLIFFGVIARYVLNAPITIIDELSTIVIVWGMVVGFTVALRSGDHIKMDIVYDTIKNERAKKAMRLFGDVVGLAYTLFIMVYGYRACAMQYRFGRVTSMMEFPVWIIYLVIPIVGALMSARYLLFIKNELTPSWRSSQRR